MLYALLTTVHLLALMLWLGGMVFVLFFLRPALPVLELPQRMQLMQAVLARFFKAVLWAALLTLCSGVWMLGRVAKQTVQAGQAFHMPLSWTLMAGLGVLMVAIFMHIRFALFKRLSRAVADSQWSPAGAVLAQLRVWVAVNLSLGLSIVVLVNLGK